MTAGGKNVAPAVLEDRVRAHALVGQCLVVGDGQPFIAALVTLDPEAVAAWADAARQVRRQVARPRRRPRPARRDRAAPSRRPTRPSPRPSRSASSRSCPTTGPRRAASSRPASSSSATSSMREHKDDIAALYMRLRPAARSRTVRARRTVRTRPSRTEPVNVRERRPYGSTLRASSRAQRSTAATALVRTSGWRAHRPVARQGRERVSSMDRRRILLIIAALVAALGTVLVFLYVQGRRRPCGGEVRHRRGARRPPAIAPGETYDDALAAGKIALAGGGPGPAARRLPDHDRRPEGHGRARHHLPG